MASIRNEIVTSAPPQSVWDAIRDIGSLHTRLVPGFVVDTRLEPGARVVTFANGMVIKELIVAVDDDGRRLVWSAEAPALTHYNASVQAFSEGAGTRVVWIADFLPDEAAAVVGPMTRSWANRAAGSALSRPDASPATAKPYSCVPARMAPASS